MNNGAVKSVSSLRVESKQDSGPDPIEEARRKLKIAKGYDNGTIHKRERELITAVAQEMKRRSYERIGK